MFNIDKYDVQRFAVSAIGAVLLSVTMIGTTVAPARAVEMAPLAQLPAQVRA